MPEGERGRQSRKPPEPGSGGCVALAILIGLGLFLFFWLTQVARLLSLD